MAAMNPQEIFKMHRFFSVAILFFCLVTAAVAAETLTNADVIKMVKAGLGADLVIGKIQETEAVRFDLTTDGLIALKQAGVTDDVIRAMKTKQAGSAGASSTLPSETPSAAPSPVPAATSSAVEQFPEAQYLVKAPGQEKAQPVKGVLVFDPGAREIRFLSSGVNQLEVPYAKLTGMLYEKTAKPRYGLGLLVAWPLLFTKSKAHYLTLQYKNSQGVGEFAIIRLHKKNFQIALATAEAQTGMKVDRNQEN
jgi:hypothetical protein